MIRVLAASFSIPRLLFWGALLSDTATSCHIYVYHLTISITESSAARSKIADQSKVVALYDFEPSKIDWPFNRQKPLALSTGQVVEIVHDDGSEWALGHLAGVPETLGYFPKNYTVSVGEYQAGKGRWTARARRGRCRNESGEAVWDWVVIFFSESQGHLANELLR